MHFQRLHFPYLTLLTLTLSRFSSAQPASYSCDPASCRLPDCACASSDPPGGLSTQDTPQFIVFTADDAVQNSTVQAIRSLLSQRRNPNGCAPRSTYFASCPYADYAQITDWYVAGNEVADHTVTHSGKPTAQDIYGNLIALNALGGVPLSAIKGFRAPYLSYDVQTLSILKNGGFTYDSSATSVQPPDAPGTDAVWPYTLDNGLVNNCNDIQGVCNGEPKIGGLWEIPMYATFDGTGSPHMMDPWMDHTSDVNAVEAWLRNTFTDHYQASRQPVGLYTHPVHLVSTVNDQGSSGGIVQMVNRYLDWAQDHGDVWIVSNEQLLNWVRNPVPVTQLGSQPYMQCPDPPPTPNICNGVPEREGGLQSRCAFSDFPFSTCYGCPSAQPSIGDPNPRQQLDSGSVVPRSRVPANCSTIYWDPVAAQCLCTDPSCAFQDVARPIGVNGASYVGGGTNMEDRDEDDIDYVDFNGGQSLVMTIKGSFQLMGLFFTVAGIIATTLWNIV